DVYFETDDNDSAYYALSSLFIDLPFPEIALAVGEEAVDDLCMQFHPKAPWDKPTAVATKTDNGVSEQHITLSSDFDTMDVVVDPTTKLLKAMTLKITGGDQVREGAVLRYAHTFENVVSDKPLPDSTFAFSPGERHKVDTVFELLPRPKAPPVGEG